MGSRHYVLSIAGFDPSSGAGITADIKTFEQHAVYGLGVCTAITYQNDCEFDGVDWMPAKDIIRQVDVLFRKYHIGYAKIGLIGNLEVLQLLVGYLAEKKVNVVWDPIVKASAGFLVHTAWDKHLLSAILQNIYLLTPNESELAFLLNLFELESPQELILQTHLHGLLLKGGHADGKDCTDTLYLDGQEIPITGHRQEGNSKHGTGCVLSAAIVSNLTLGKTLLGACEAAKKYVERLIKSNPSLLGYHT